MVLISTRSQRSGLFLLAISFVLLGLPSCGSEAAGAEGRGRALYDSCMPCHGPSGEGQQNIAAPAIAGMDAWYVKDQLENFRNSRRGFHHTDLPGQRMRPMSRTLLNDGDVEAVSAYVASMPVRRPEPTLTAGDPVKGKAGFALCMACHGPTGEGMQALHSPSLLKTDDWYLLSQLEHFKAGRRGTATGDTWGSTMRPNVLTMETAKMLDIIAYINTLGR